MWKFYERIIELLDEHRTIRYWSQLARKYGVYDKMKPYTKKGFNFEQFRQILWGLRAKLDVSVYANPEYDCFQMSRILLGLEKGLPVDAYANPNFSGELMDTIRLALEDDLDITPYVRPEFDDWQISQIYMGLKSGLDVSIYAKPEYSSHHMKEIRLAMENNHHEELFKFINAGIFYIIGIKDFINKFRFGSYFRDIGNACNGSNLFS